MIITLTLHELRIEFLGWRYRVYMYSSSTSRLVFVILLIYGIEKAYVCVMNDATLVAYFNI